MRYLGTCPIWPSTSKRAITPMVLVAVMPDHEHASERPSRASLRSVRSQWPTGCARTTLARHAGTTWGLGAHTEHNAATRGRRQLEEEEDLDPRDDGGDGGATCRRCTRPKATFELSRTFVGQRGHVVVTAPAQELTRRARQRSARWKCSGRGQEAGMLGPRGANPRARLQAQRQRKCEECAPSCARGRKKAPRRGSEEEPPLRCQTRSFVIQSEGDEAKGCVRHVPSTRGLTLV